uniref:Uncharacterized protein n=1 Tax=Romanomermis culicivorax TaxID=13658 RepID=A0A915KXJ2_ROMCU
MFMARFSKSFPDAAAFSWSNLQPNCFIDSLKCSKARRPQVLEIGARLQMKKSFMPEQRASNVRPPVILAPLNGRWQIGLLRTNCEVHSKVDMKLANCWGEHT